MNIQAEPSNKRKQPQGRERNTVGGVKEGIFRAKEAMCVKNKRDKGGTG